MEGNVKGSVKGSVLLCHVQEFLNGTKDFLKNWMRLK